MDLITTHLTEQELRVILSVINRANKRLLIKSDVTEVFGNAVMRQPLYRNAMESALEKLENALYTRNNALINNP